MDLEDSTCVICCCPCPVDRSKSDKSLLISQIICKIFVIQDDFQSLVCCPNCSSQILKIHKILEELDEAKLQLEQIIIKNAAAAGDYILDQNSTEIARNEIIKRISPFVNPVAVNVNIKLEEVDDDGLNEVLEDVLNDPDWNMSDDEDNYYIEKTDNEKSPEAVLGLEQSNLDHIEVENLQFNLKTPVLILTKLPQSLVNQFTQKKHVDLKSIQNEIDQHLKKDQNQTITNRVKSSLNKKEFACTKCDRSYDLKKVLKEHEYMKHGGGSTNKPTCPVKNCKSKKPYSNKNSLKSHIISKHPNVDWLKIRHNYTLNRVWKCNFCIRKFWKEESRKEHEDKQHSKCTITTKPKRVNPSLNKKKFACTKCDRSYDLKKVLKEHDYVKHGGGTTNKPKCPIPNCKSKKPYSDKNSLKSHILYKHPNVDWSKIRDNYTLSRSNKCNFCIRKFWKEESRNEHEKKQHPKCSICDKRLSSPISYDQHMKTAHTKEFPEICHVCGRGFPNVYLLKTHLLSHERAKLPKKFICGQCPEVFSDFDSLWFHRRKHKEEASNNEEVKKFDNKGKEKLSLICDLCGCSLATHMRVKHGVGGSKYSCGPCGLEFYSIHDMKKHNSRSSHKLKANDSNGEQDTNQGIIKKITKDLKCTFESCPKRFKDKAAIRNHIIAVHQKGFPCEFCQKNLSSESALKNHIKDRHKSDDELKFPCSMCQRRFFDESRLNVHLKWHEKKVKLAEVRFKCDVCQKEVKNRQSFIIHQRTHTGERPFSCEMCDRSFTIKQMLKNHQATTHSDEKNIHCTVCNKSFKVAKYLSRHRLSSPGCRV